MLRLLNNAMMYFLCEIVTAEYFFCHQKKMNETRHDVCVLAVLLIFWSVLMR